MIDTNRSFGKELKIIKEFDIPNAVLAKVIGCSSGNLADKINNKNGGRFTDAQKDLITAYLKRLGRAISKL